MEVIHLLHLIFIRTDSGCYMVDTTAKSGKAITVDCFNLISEISELKKDIKEIR